MFKRCSSLLFFSLLVTSLQLAAQTSFPTVYVSTGAGQQILAIDGNAGTITGLCSVTFVPEDVVVGPDANLYVADPGGNRIWRVAPGALQTPVSPAPSCAAQKIYDLSTLQPQACTTTSVPPTPVNCPTGPEGPSFLRISTLDLYFNTHGTNTGVWRISDIAGASEGCVAPACPAPVQVVGAFGASASGEGVDFDLHGNLLAVDQADNQVFRAIAPSFSTALPFVTTNLSAPFGVALNTCGDLLVASGKAVNRYDGNTGGFLDSLRFTGNDLPKFLEVDSANKLFVVTASNEAGQGGTVSRFDPPAANSTTSCGLGSFKNAFSLALKANLVPGLNTGNALGLGLSASNFQTPALPFSSANPTQTYDFGTHTIAITCNGVVSPFSLAVTALKSRPTDAANPEVTFNPPTNWPATTTTQCPSPLRNPQCIHYGSNHGFCTQYAEQAFDATGNPLTDAQMPNFCSATPNPFTFFLSFLTAEFTSNPGGAHVTTDGVSIPTAPYTDCQSQDFYTPTGNGLDPLRIVGSNSKHVAFNSGLAFNGTITITSPTSSCGIASLTCNPQFNQGQNIPVKFRLTDNLGNAINGATEQLSILRIRHTTKNQTTIEAVPQTVVATKNSSTLNFFTPNSAGQYSYNDDSSAFDPLPRGTTAVYQLTIWGNGAPPFSFDILVAF